MQKSLLFTIGSLILLAGCLRIETKHSGMRVEHDAGGDVLEYNVIPGKGMVDPQYGEERWFGMGALSGTEGTAANGMTQLHVMQTGDSLITMQLNIAQAAPGMEYRAWLLGSTGSRIDAGTFDPFLGDVRHRLNYKANRDLRDHLSVEVTTQKAGAARGPVIATGTMTERKRPN